MSRLEGKVAVVTGASSGIGEATAEALSREGAAVVAAARRKERLSSLIERIEKAGGRAIAVPCDVTDEEQAQKMILRAKEEFGRVDILVNNAGVMLLSRVDKGLTDQWRQMFEVNVMGLLYATNAALPIMKEQGSGHIINISSVAGRKVRPTGAIYSGTKWAVNAISEGLRQELLEDDIRITVIEPGAVETELASHITDEDALAEQRRRFGTIEPLQAEDIAAAIVYAATQPSRVSVNEVLIRPTRQAN